MLEEEFYLTDLHKNHIEETKWKTLVSEFQAMNSKKKSHLNSKLSKLSKVNQSQVKFIKLEENEEEAELEQELNSLEGQLSELDSEICSEESRREQYQQVRRNMKQSIQLMQQEIYDDKMILNVLSKQEVKAVNRLYQLENQNNYTQVQALKGNDYIQQQELQMQSQLNQLKQSHNNIKNEVQKQSKTYNYLKRLEQEKESDLARSGKTIEKLDIESEMKRDAKRDSQTLLIHILAMEILASLFIGTKTEHDIIKQVSQEYWIQEGRVLVDQRLSQKDYLQIYEQKSGELLQQQFSLKEFPKQLTQFYEFCDQNVDLVVDTLKMIFKYETIYQDTLQTRYSDVVFKISSLQVDLSHQQAHIQTLTLNSLKHSSFDQYAAVLGITDNPISLNLMQKIQNHNDKFRSQESQRVIWRFLSFLTNGLYRWLNIILNFNKVIELDHLDLLTQCQKLIHQQHTGVNEIFPNDEQRHQQMLSILHHSLSKLNHLNPHQEQLNQIFVYLKNDFIFYNWGSLSQLESLLNEKIKMFNELTFGSDPVVYTQLLESLPNFVSPICIQLSDQAFNNFQHHFLNLLNRFIDFFKAIKSLPETISLRQRQRYSTLRKASDLTKSQSKPEGLFGEDVNFRQQVNKRRFEKHHHPTQVPEDWIEVEYNHDNYMRTRQEIFESQDFEAIELEKMRILKEQAKKAEKPYEAKTKTMRQRESQMKELIKLNNMIASTSAMNRKAPLEKFQLQQIRRKNLNVQSRYQIIRTNKTFSTKLSQTKTLPSLKTATPKNKRKIDKNLRVPTYLMPDKVNEILTARENKESFLTSTAPNPLYSSYK